MKQVHVRVECNYAKLASKCLRDATVEDMIARVAIHSG